MYLILLLISLVSASFADRPYFLPPSGWEIAQLKTPSQCVQVGFIGKGSTDFQPSVSLSIEEVDDDLTLAEYMKAVKAIQLADRNQYRDLGKFAMKGGKGRLIEITATNGWGVVKMLQAILLKNSTVYILTGAVIKEDFTTLQSAIVKCFRTLDVVPNLWSPIQDSQKRQNIEELYSALGSTERKDQSWEQFKKQVTNFSDLGPYWQFITLQEGKLKHFPSPQE